MKHFCRRAATSSLHRDRLLAVALEVPAGTVAHVRKQRVHAGRGHFGLPRIELVFNLAVLLRDRVEPLHLDRAEGVAGFGIGQTKTKEEIVAGVDECGQQDRGGEPALRDHDSSAHAASPHPSDAGQHAARSRSFDARFFLPRR